MANVVPAARTDQSGRNSPTEAAVESSIEFVTAAEFAAVLAAWGEPSPDDRYELASEAVRQIGGAV